MKIEEKLNKLVINNQIEEAIKLAEEKLITLPQTDFQKIIGRNLLHLTAPLIKYINTFYSKAKSKIDVKAIYSEMNGFTINYDLWCIELFAFTKCGDFYDLDWLSDFEVISRESMTINGFEDLQAVFKNYIENEISKNEKLKESCEICELLIILRLQELFKSVKTIAVNENLVWSKVPLFVTAHDNDLIYMVKPESL